MIDWAIPLLLVKQINTLQEEVNTLKEILSRNSSNSSLPPSLDNRKKKTDKKGSPSSTPPKKPGGRPGHRGSHRALLPIEQVTEVIPCLPLETCDCGGVVKRSKKVWRHQVYEIPKAQFDVFEYQVHKGCCKICDKKHYGTLPTGVTGKGYGAKTHSLISLMGSKYHLSKRQIQAFLKDLFGMPVSLGSVSNVEATVTQAVGPMHDALKAAVKEASIVHMDETGHRQQNKNGWAWIAVTPEFSYFSLEHSRGRKVVKELIHSHLNRIFITDRYKAYDYLPAQNHQVCWAHLKRDFKKISERKGVAGDVGEELLRWFKKIFGYWKQELKEKPVFSPRQRKKIKYYKRRVEAILWRGVKSGHPQTSRTCQNILDCGESLWQFLTVTGVSPTNNLAERQLRPLVIKKKLSFGTRSARGSRFIERLFTLVMTAKQQNKNIFELLIQAMNAYFSSQAPPLLI